MALAPFEYNASGVVSVFYQDSGMGAALGNTPASRGGGARMPDKLKPRRVSLRYGSAPYTYKHPVVGLPATLDGLVVGSTVNAGVVVGKDWGYDNSKPVI
jgi:hypothetical protein